MSAVGSYTFANGDKMPLIGLGTWKSDPGVVKSAVKESIKLGYRHIDCAAAYENEKEVGEALAECFAEGIVKRNELWITSKLWNDNHEPHNVIPALKKTLSDLQLDYLDSYLIHWPVSLKHGVGFPTSAEDMMEFDTPRTWGAMETTVDAGLARHIGVSNFSKKKLQSVLDVARIKPSVNQIERHPYLQSEELATFCKENDIHITNYASLGSGDRPAAFKPVGEPVLMQDPKILDIAEKNGVSAAQILLKWGLAAGSSVIPKSVNPSRLKQNLGSEAVQLDDKDLAEIRAMDLNRRYVDGTFWCLENAPYTLASLWDEDVDSAKSEL